MAQRGLRQRGEQRSRRGGLGSASNELGRNEPTAREQAGLGARCPGLGEQEGSPGGSRRPSQQSPLPGSPSPSCSIKVPIPTSFSLSLTKISSLQEFSMARESYQALFVPFIYETPFDLSAKCSKHCNIKLLSLQH